MRFLFGPIAIHDDQASIIRNEEVYRMNVRACFTARRPIVELLNRWTYRRWGFAPLPWHLENLFLHAVAVALLYMLVGRLGWSHPAWIALAFAAHPIQTHSWVYVTGRSGILAAIFLFIAARLYVTPWPVAAVVPALLALCCREDSLVFILWLPFLEYFR